MNSSKIPKTTILECTCHHAHCSNEELLIHHQSYFYSYPGPLWVLEP